MFRQLGLLFSNGENEMAYINTRLRHKERRINRKFPYKKYLKVLLLIVLVPILTYDLFAGDTGFVTFQNKLIYKSQLNELISQERARSDSLLLIIHRLNCDTLLFEEIARIRLGMSRPGEKVYKFQNVTKSSISFVDSVSSNEVFTPENKKFRKK